MVIGGTLIAIGMTCLMLSAVIFAVMLGEVNATLPQEKKLSIWGWDIIKANRVFIQHEELYPASRLRFQYMILFPLGILLDFAGLIYLLLNRG